MYLLDISGQIFPTDITHVNLEFKKSKIYLYMQPMLYLISHDSVIGGPDEDGAREDDPVCSRYSGKVAPVLPRGPHACSSCNTANTELSL